MIARNLLSSISLLAAASLLLADRCVAGISADPARLRRLAESSPAIVTALNPFIGYEAAAAVAHEALATGRTIAEVVIGQGFVARGEITPDQLERALDVLAMARPHRLGNVSRNSHPALRNLPADPRRLPPMQSVLGSGHLVAGRYRLLDQLGRGAMGIVWRSRDELLDREVAVKQIVLPLMASQAEAEESYQRTLREARTAARLSHPGVVTVFDVVEEDGTPWIVMELVRARPLDHVIAEDGPLPPAEAAQLGRELLDALTTAHAAGVLHRDVKPSNVLVGRDGKAVLTDFGVAMVQGDPALTQAGMVVGTPGFAPPERVRGEPATPASDLWSLGATLYAAVEGRGPFDRAGGSAAIVASVATEPAPRAPSAGPLAPVIEALLRADPAQRPDAAATARMLSEAATRTPGPAAGLLADQAAGSGGPDALAVPGPDVMEATTATQVVLVPGAIEAPGGRPGDGQPGVLAGGPLRTRLGQPGAATDAATDAAATGAGAATNALGRQPGAGAGAPPAPAGTVLAPAGSGPTPGVIPDLMATPVFAELKMPEPQASPDLPQRTSALGQPGRPGQPADQASQASQASQADRARTTAAAQPCPGAPGAASCCSPPRRR